MQYIIINLSDGSRGVIPLGKNTRHVITKNRIELSSRELLSNRLTFLSVREGCKEKKKYWREGCTYT